MASHERLARESSPSTLALHKPAAQPFQATQPPALTSTPDAMSLMKALRRRWFLAGAMGILLAGIVGAAAIVLLPARFTAFALLQVSSKMNPLSGVQPN